MIRARSLVKTLSLASIGFFAALLVTKDSYLAEPRSLTGWPAHSVAVACIQESNTANDELYFISCGGIY